MAFGMMKALVVAGGMSGLFASQAAADNPLLFEPSDSAFTQTVHGCTADGALMEVRFSFDIHPLYAQNYLNTQEKVDGAERIIQEHVQDVLSPLWQDILKDVQFSEIEQGEAKPLKPLLEALYTFTDSAFNDIQVSANADNILPVLRGGAYVESHEFCNP